MDNQSGDLISKLKTVNKPITTDEINLAEDIFQVQNNTISSNKFLNKQSLLAASVIMVIYIILNLNFVIKFIHKFIKNENIVKFLNIFIIFLVSYLTIHFIAKND